MRCKLCNEPFEDNLEFDRHLSYVHGTVHLQVSSGLKHLKEDIIKMDPEGYQKFQDSKFCKICHKHAFYELTVIHGDNSDYAGSCLEHQELVNKILSENIS